jgi:asparagine synthase (glutamine-hydrolysing)
MRPGSMPRISIEMGLVGVLATQLWHQTFIDTSLADVPAARKSRPALAAV